MRDYANGKVRSTTDNQVTTVVINRADVKNACDVETVKGLYDAFQDFEQDDDAKAAVLTGAGNSFCAGADLAELASGASIGFSWAGTDKGVTRRRLSKPVIAAVEGHAVAAGLALAVWCDMRVASDTAVFGVFCRRFGGPMPNGCTVRLPRIIGESRALDMLMTGRPVAADEALLFGLADRRVAAGTALEEAQALAQQLARFPQLALLSDRASSISQWDFTEVDAIDREIEGSKPAFEQQFQSGAGRFVGGQGRHGDFS
ncbi:crotonase/enoyl-CoA hydratase family protein [Sneathiella marina]|uniref:Crotonase/enoyl-CoA hydratase family protein n=1 Tax=Sneathiella marina TaxID=2950108 RepID=A0ABY4W124_9PROT|nr:crotonase/enoyl-CoA hydratase family protein [Sneathiella marina]USG60912.1 crotonase/enoyl-CoA hydratase family protein [Sneathiella marina]